MSSPVTPPPSGACRVMLFCVPRSVSTALTKCLSFVEDSEIWLEPYLMSKSAEESYDFCYKRDLPADFVGNEKAYRDAAEAMTFAKDIESCKLDWLSPVVLKREFDNLNTATKFVFVKDMSFGVSPGRYKYLPDKSSGFRYAFLTRNPVKVYASQRERLLAFIDDDSVETITGLKRPNPETWHMIDDLPQPTDGTSYLFKAQHGLWEYIRDNLDDNPVILDIDDLLNDPAAMLPRFCHALGIPYADSLLQWDESDDITVKWKSAFTNVRLNPRYAMWFESAFKSTCFKASGRSASLNDTTPDVRDIVEKELPYYEDLYNHRLTV